MEIKGTKKDDKNEILPQVIRQLILHDRGNSIFLSDSFGNLPSPVNESQSLKKMFKVNEEEEMKKN